MFHVSKRLALVKKIVAASQYKRQRKKCLSKFVDSCGKHGLGHNFIIMITEQNNLPHSHTGMKLHRGLSSL